MTHVDTVSSNYRLGFKDIKIKKTQTKTSLLKCFCTLWSFIQRSWKCVHTRTCTQIFKAASFIAAKKWKHPKCPSTDEWINKICYIHAMEYYSTIKGMNYWYLLQHKWILKMLSERCQTEKGRNWKDPFLWNVQNRQIHRDGK